MIEYIETDAIDDLFCFDDLIVFPASMLKEMSSFTLALREYPLFTIHDDCVPSCVIVARVNFAFGCINNSITFVYGMGVLNFKNYQLLYLHAIDILTMSMMIGCMHDMVGCKIHLPKTTSKCQMYLERMSTYSNENLVGFPNMMRMVTSIVLQKYDADVMAKTVDFDVESAGTMYVSYIDGQAIFHIDIDSMIRGTSQFVNESYGNSHFKFHSHPDSVMFNNGSFIAYPSANDIRAVARTYIPQAYIPTSGCYPHIGHFVSSPEGLWVIKPTYHFQCLIQQITQQELHDDIDILLDDIYLAYTPLDHKRLKNTIPVSQRHLIKHEYLDIVSNMKLKNISNYIATKFGLFKNSPMFSIELIEWSLFSESYDVEITFEHLFLYKLI
jgi:hypothetical protein